MSWVSGLGCVLMEHNNVPVGKPSPNLGFKITHQAGRRLVTHGAAVLRRFKTAIHLHVFGSFSFEMSTKRQYSFLIGPNPPPE